MKVLTQKFYTVYSSPLGQLTIQACDQGLLGAWFEQQTTQPEELGARVDNHPILKQAIQEYEEYFAGTRKEFEVTIAAQGTHFQNQVWQALTQIPFGQTRYYAQLADVLNNPKAVRAVGLANGKNPISIIVPCHRVIGKNGSLTGYAGGIEIKQALLCHEGSFAEQVKLL